MVNRKTEFLLLTCHTDEEITAFLQRNAEEGWWLTCNRGNRFEFEAIPYQGRRICSYSFSSHDLQMSTEEQLRRELPFLRHQGWDMICISGPENVADSTRHAFLYDEHPDMESPKPVPQSDKRNEAVSVRRSRRKSVSNLLICVIFLLFSLLEFHDEMMKIVSSNFYLGFGLIVFLLLSLSLAVSFLAVIHSFSSRTHNGEKLCRFRFIDAAAGLTWLLIVVLCCLLVVDSLWGGVQGHGTRTKVNGSNLTLYSDEIPVGLDELEMDTSGAFRSSRFQSSGSLISSYGYGSDESIDDEAELVSYVGYHLFSSKWGWLRDIAARMLFQFSGNADTDAAAALKMDSMLISPDEKSILLESGNDVLVIKASVRLSVNQIDLISRSLMNR